MITINCCKYYDKIVNFLYVESDTISKLLIEFNSKKQAEMYERAMRGFLKNGDNFLINAAKKVGKNPEDIEKFICDNACNPEFKEICNEVFGEENRVEMFGGRLEIEASYVVVNKFFANKRIGRAPLDKVCVCRAFCLLS